jgi:hypothetical protein
LGDWDVTSWSTLSSAPVQLQVQGPGGSKREASAGTHVSGDEPQLNVSQGVQDRAQHQVGERAAQAGPLARGETG